MADSSSPVAVDTADQLPSVPHTMPPDDAAERIGEFERIPNFGFLPDQLAPYFQGGGLSAGPINRRRILRHAREAQQLSRLCKAAGVRVVFAPGRLSEIDADDLGGELQLRDVFYVSVFNEAIEHGCRDWFDASEVDWQSELRGVLLGMAEALTDAAENLTADDDELPQPIEVPDLKPVPLEQGQSRFFFYPVDPRIGTQPEFERIEGVIEGVYSVVDEPLKAEEFLADPLEPWCEIVFRIEGSERDFHFDSIRGSGSPPDLQIAIQNRQTKERIVFDRRYKPTVEDRTELAEQLRAMLAEDDGEAELVVVPVVEGSKFVAEPAEAEGGAA